MMFQAVLVQNTAWSNVEKTCAAIGGRLRPESSGNFAGGTGSAHPPCGFCRGKARAIRALTAWFGKYGFKRQNAAGVSTEELREELLAIRGVGAETADVILVYAFFRPSFIVDAYTRRLLGRLGHDFADDAAIKEFFEGALLTRRGCMGIFIGSFLSTASARAGRRRGVVGARLGKCASGRCDTAYLQPTFSVISERIAILKASQAKKGWMKMKNPGLYCC